MRFAILFDNYTSKLDFVALWGFSCYIPELKFLFDTGSNGRILLKNAQKMGVDLSEARYLFLSHPHWDHIGGLDTVLEINSQLVLFVPQTFSPRLVADLQQFAKEVVVVSKKPMQLFDGCYSTGVMGELEHSLVIEGFEGTRVISGCSHPGVVAIARRAQQITGQKLRYIIGGFHLFQKEPGTILSVAKELLEMGVECVTPTHCSGEVAMEIFEKLFGARYWRGGVGEVIEC